MTTVADSGAVLSSIAMTRAVANFVACNMRRASDIRHDCKPAIRAGIALSGVTHDPR
jgi:hypothetical protein